MSEPDWKRAKEIFGEALARPAGERAAVVGAACAGDDVLRGLVEGLLSSHDAAGAFMGAPTGDGHGAASNGSLPGAERIGEKIGPYTLLRVIGEGGFGVVYEAQQDEPLSRRVAVKVIKLGMDTRQVIARFEQERRALAVMDHPSIAKVFDAGATASGRPYFVMELIDGIPITQYCDEQRLTPRERLELFIPVCQAVQHAHTKGIIHRDIKPSNVLVTVQDGKAIPKVIDFGVAKATAQGSEERTAFTDQRQLIGTPEYMSPEQAGMGGGGGGGRGDLRATGPDIDTRSDVYSLGVLLYELLVGATPFDAKQLRSAAFAEMQRIIREVDPPKPSTRLSTLETLASVAACRQVEPRRMGAVVRGDLDWIVMKCLEKERSRRYETANGLAADVQRYLAGEAVVAAPPGARYRFRKFVQRNKGPVAAAALVAAALVLGTVGTTVGLVQAQRETRIARDQRANAEKIAEFMEQILKGVHPGVARGRDTALLREMMDGAAKRIADGELRDSPEAELRLRLAIGAAYDDLSALEEAGAMLAPVEEIARAIQPGDSALLARTLDVEADVFLDEPRAREAVAMRRRLNMGDDPEVATGLIIHGRLLHGLGTLEADKEAEPLLRASLEMRRRLFPGDHPSTAQSMTHLAAVVNVVGRRDEANDLYREALAMRRRLYPGDHPAVLESLSELSEGLRNQRRNAEAEPLSREALEMSRRLYGSDNLKIAHLMNQLGATLDLLGRAEEAEPLYREALAICRRKFPEDSPQVAANLRNLALNLARRGQVDRALPLMNEAAAMRGRLAPNDADDAILRTIDMADMLSYAGRFAEMEQPLRDAWDAWRQLKRPGSKPPDPLTPGIGDMLPNRLGNVLIGLGRYSEAEGVLRQGLADQQLIFGKEHHHVASSMYDLSRALLELERPEEAESAVREGLAMKRRLWQSEDHEDVSDGLLGHSRALRALGLSREAESPARDALGMRQRILKGDHLSIAEALENLGLVLGDLGRADDSQANLRDALGMRQRAFKGDHPDTARAMAELAGCLAHLGKLEEARSLAEDALALARRTLPAGHPAIAQYEATLADIRNKAGK